MTTDEKLQRFFTICMEDARAKSNRIFDDYAAALTNDLEEHKADARRQAQMQLQGESEKIQREMNKELAIEQMNLKRSFSLHHNELKEKLFIEVKNLLDNFMETPKYHSLLDSYIKSAKKFAGTDELIFYMDPVDSGHVNQLAYLNNVNIQISEYSFGGGIRAVIPSRNILIDHSFDNKFNEAKRTFQFEIGGASNG